ncbi:MAG TPA: hypothetical protein VM198_05410, partial [Longimicrobiales bacterium]|nr:hypothetical protein [Longimicrobiales bacterium]
MSAQRTLIAVAAATLLAPALLTAQVPVTVETDVVYSRTNGSAVLADIAYPVGASDLPVIIYVHGGRWRSGERVNEQGLQVAE